MRSLELIIGFLGIPTLGGLLLLFLARSQRALDRRGRTSARKFVVILGWVVVLHISFFLMCGLEHMLAGKLNQGTTWLALLARLIAVVTMGIAVQAALRHGSHRESDEEDPLPISREREQSTDRTRLLTCAILMVGFPFFIPGLIALLPISIFLVLEDLIAGLNRQVRENRLLWTLALAVRHGRPLAAEVSALAISLEADYRRSWWSLMGWGRGYPRRVDRLAQDLEFNPSLTSALLNTRSLLSPETIGVIAAAEDSGRLAEVLPELAGRHARRITSQINGESVYTTIFYVWTVLLITVNVASFVMYWIIPKMKAIFDGFGVELPLLTQKLINFGEFWVDFWFIMLPLLGLPTTIMFLLQRFSSGNHQYLRWLTRWYPRLESPHLLSQLAFCVESGQSLPQQVQALADVELVESYHRRLERLQGLLEVGTPLPIAMEAENFINRREAAALDSATTMGHLSWALEAVSRKMQEQRGELFRWLMKIGEPLLIIGVALLVALFCLAMFLPLTALLGHLS